MQEKTLVQLDYRKQADIVEKLRKQQKQFKVQQLRLRNNALIQSHSPKPLKPDTKELARDLDAGILKFDIKDDLFPPENSVASIEKELQGGFFN